MADDTTTTAAIIAAVTGVMSAGAFKFYEFILKQKREVKQEEKAEQMLYRDDLIRRVEKLESEREDRIEETITFRTEISSMKVQLDFLKQENELLKGQIQLVKQENQILKDTIR
jgi:hypothetical protein